MGPVDVRHPALPDLFDPALPNAPLLFGILAGDLPGRAIADDAEHPTMAAVQAPNAIAFTSRTTRQADFDATLSGLRRDATVGLVWPGDSAGSVEPEAPARSIARLGFDAIDPADERFARLRADLPADLTVRPMDPELLARCEWLELVVDAHGSIEAFLARGSGLCLMRGDEIVAEAYAPFIGRGVAEVGVVTPEPHRGHGYASVAIAFLAKVLAGRGLAMYWSCDADNDASIRVAAKLGFGPPRPFGILLYRPLEA
ncbi:MAG: GNAT family N-acetyltransferase [Chloroflexota bacterium]